MFLLMLGGNRVIRYWMMRDLVLGLEVVVADGTILSMLNKMIKKHRLRTKTGIYRCRGYVGCNY